MARFTITVNLDNDAFYSGDATAELEWIVGVAAHKAMNSPCGPSGCSGSVLDSNGNTVGGWVVVN